MKKLNYVVIVAEIVIEKENVNRTKVNNLYYSMYD